KRLGNTRHLAWTVIARRTALEGENIVVERLTMGGAAVARTESAAGHADIAGQSGKASDRTRTLPSIAPLEHRTAAENDHGRTRRRIKARNIGNPLSIDAGDALSPLRRMRPQMLRKRVEPDRIASDEVRLVQPFEYDDVHHAQGQSRIGTGTDDQRIVGFRPCLGPPHANRDDVRTAFARRDQVTRRVGLACEIGPPQQDHRRVRTHVLLGVGLEYASEAEPESTK